MNYTFLTDRLAVGDVASRSLPGFVAVVSLLTVHSEGRPWGPELTDKTPKVPNGCDVDELGGVPVLVIDIADGEERYRGQFSGNVHDRDLDEWLGSATSFIARHIEFGCVLVHCGAGISRSVAVIVAYLCRYAGMSYSEALSFVKARRPQAAPCDAFHRAVVRWLRLDELAAKGPRGEAAAAARPRRRDVQQEEK